MKKSLFLVCLCLVSVLTANAQMIDAEELEKYAINFLKLPEKPSSKEWSAAALKLKYDDIVALDKNNAMTWSEVIPAEGITKEKLYVILNYWYTMTFNSAKAVIQLNDKDAGAIIGKGFVANIVGHMGGMNKYEINMEPIIKSDIKEGKVRITFTIQSYPVYKASTNIVGAFAGALLGVGGQPKTTAESWMISKCYPFASKDKHKVASAKAICVTTAFSDYIMNKIKEAIQHGLSGNENDDW